MDFPPLLEDFADTESDSRMFDFKDTRADQSMISLELDPLTIIKREYPRIHEKTVKGWGTQDLQNAFTRWIFTDQQGRRGWNLKVLTALMELADTHAEQFKLSGSLGFNFERDAW